jgi:thiol-disulfide isomerase/thioredoxin
MRSSALIATLFLSLCVRAESPAGSLWNDLKAKREKLPGLHQEFDVSQTFNTAHGDQSSKWQTIIDIAGQEWREKSVMGSGNSITIFDGKDLLSMEEGDDEFTRTKRHSHDEDPVPSPYRSKNPDWSKATELERRPCGIPGSDHLCVVLDVPLKPWMESNPNSSLTKSLGGAKRVLLDTQTGMLLSLSATQAFSNGRGTYQTKINYVLRRFNNGPLADASLFALPSNEMREVKELSRWDATKIKKRLAGGPAPALALTDIKGAPIALAAAKGKTVLLDFWTTWCPPCRADAPALDKLFLKYGGQDLMIVGISVNEDRAIVEKFLKEHPHSFPVALTTENEMPRAYQIGVFPTYVVIDRDGTLASAVDGEKGFADLRKLLKKAGLETE